MKKLTTFKLVDYFDVWGNADDGYEVNNLCTQEEGLYIAEECTDAEVIEFLKKIDYLNEYANEETINLEWIDEDYCEITNATNGMPLGRLEREWGN